MFDFAQIYYFYFDLLPTVFSVIILIAALIVTPGGIWAVRNVKVNVWGAAVSFALYLASLLYMCYSKITLKGILVTNILADVFLGAVLGFIVSVIVLKVRERASEE